MRNSITRMNLTKLNLRRVTAALLLLTFCLLNSINVQAQTTTFAQFTQRFATNDFVFDAFGFEANFQAKTGFSPSSAGIPGTAVNFFFTNIPGLPAELQGNQEATLYLNGNTSQPASQILIPGSSSVRDIQPFNQTITIQIVRDQPASVGSGTRRNLLTVIISPIGSNYPAISGDDGGNSASFTATTPDHIVSFTSDFLNFTQTGARNLALSFSSVTPALALDIINPNGSPFLRDFVAAGTGTFAADRTPVIILIPTAASVDLSGRVMANGRGVGNAMVTMTEADGTVRSARTGAMGHYRFLDVSAGQTVTVEAFAKRYQFAPRVLEVRENVGDLNFTSER